MKWLPSSGRMRGDLAPVGHELTALSSAMTAWRDVQHDEDGAHTAITADSIETTGLNALGGPTQIPDVAVLEPPTILAGENNYNPPGLADVRVVRITTDASHAITGILTDPRYNRDLRLINAGNFDVTIPHNSASSFALYRIACPLGTTLTVGSGAVVDLYYDIHAGNWRVVGGSGTITGLMTGGVSDGDKGDITVSASGATFTVDNDVVTNAKAANMAADTIKGRAHGAGTGDPTDLTANQTSTILDTATDPFLRTSAASTGAPTSADYLVKTANGSLSAERVVTDTSTVTWDWATAGQAKANMVARVGVIQITVGDGATVIGTGVKGFVSIPVACTLTGWRLLSTDPAATSGAIQIDVWKDTYTNYPPDNSDSITNAHEPAIAATNKKAENTNLSNWTTTAVTAGDVIGFNVDTVTSLTRATLQLQLTVP